MRILYVTHQLPYPPTDGGRIATLNAIRGLSRNHQVFLASLVWPGELDLVHCLRTWCAEVVAVPAVPWRKWARTLRGAFATPPGTAALYLDQRLRHAIRHLAGIRAVDVMLLDHLNTAAYRDCAPGVPVVLREHNVEHEIWERQAAVSRNPWLRSCAARLRRYEAAAAEQCACCVAISRRDAEALREIAPRAHVVEIPAGIDCASLPPGADAETVPASMVTVGSYAWKPKQHNLRALAEKVFPRVRAALPGAALTVVGRAMPRALRRDLERRGIQVTGEVADVRPYLRGAALALNYVEVGGGLPLKVLEALALRKPVLATPLGSQGLALQPGRDLCVASTPDQFASAAVALLRDPGERERIAFNGHRQVLANYSGDAVAARFEALLAGIVSRHRSLSARRKFA